MGKEGRKWGKKKGGSGERREEMGKEEKVREKKYIKVGITWGGDLSWTRTGKMCEKRWFLFQG